MHGHESQAHFLSGKKIIVAGAGVSGLAFVIALQKLWPPSVEPPVVIVYDRDAEQPTAGRGGYSLSLNGLDRDSGLYALKQLGLLDEIIQLAVFRVEDQGEGKGHFTMWTHDFQPMITVRPKVIEGLPTSGMRIARKDLRRVLVEAASARTKIQWGTTCTSVQNSDDGRLRIQLVKEGSTETAEECDILVAADGASSKVRACLRPDDNLEFAGAVQFAGSAKFEGSLPSPLDTNWGGVLTGTGAACFFSRVDQYTLVWALSILESAPRPRYDNSDAEQVQEFFRQARELGKDIREPFKTIVDATDPSTTLVLNARDKQPFPHNLKAGSVVFIGDSNHAVSPFAGNGANLALKDGWDLAEQLCQSDNLTQAVMAYDKRSLPRAISTLKSSHWRIKVGHATGLGYWMYRLFFTLAGTMMKLFGQ
ncbi:putative monooxygenase [Xylaria bambusicola]|uniref:putative monooxygenase n=1 Tax=Xylaria bambusicola TaxID=326684 RepID=UPI0020072C34|nr:putative monooxygenase [Xylaria bambusicola]KAI0506652.1 putative monooxygenase [Xylaria bambusicola]